MAAFRMAARMQARGHDVRVVTVESTTLQTAERSPAGLVWRDESVEGIPVRWLSFDAASMPNGEAWEYDNRAVGNHLEGYLAQERPDVFVLYSGYLFTGRAILTAKAADIPTVVILTEFWYLCRRLTMLHANRSLSDLPIDPVRCAECIAQEKRRFRVMGSVAPRLMRHYWSLRTDKVREIEERLAFNLHALEQADAIVSPSRFLASKYIEAGVPATKIVYCRHGQADGESVLQATSDRTAEVDQPASPQLRLAYIGQIAWHKGVHVLVEACRKLPQADLQLRIFGNLEQVPDYTAELRRVAKGDARIRFEGYFAPDEIDRIYQEIDVLVVPSMWYENSPLTIFEAFRYGSPVVASNIGGMAEAVQHNVNGLLFALGDADDLAKQLQRLVYEPELVERLRQGIEPVKTIDEEAAELESIFLNLQPVRYELETAHAAI